MNNRFCVTEAEWRTQSCRFALLCFAMPNERTYERKTANQNISTQQRVFVICFILFNLSVAYSGRFLSTIPNDYLFFIKQI